ncbi:LysR family transcriptional regulator (plasmid) [Pseudomonas sp. App30]|uniref:LysR family transcriptional regulator n=1 Tax=Pseudomonas sp. App30 TaxID=3068990 RepID=UPI003A805A46
MDQLNAMRIFIKVSELGSFTAAANAMDLSTASISRSIAELENTIQARLMQRNTRRLSLTEVGDRYLASCKDILFRIEEAASEAGQSILKPSGCLKVYSDSEFAVECLVPLIVEYNKTCPDVSLEFTLSTGPRPGAISIDHQDVQISLSNDLPDSEMIAQQLGCFPNVLCTSPGYLGAHGIPTHPRDLNDHICLRSSDQKLSEQWVFEGDGEVPVQASETFKVNVANALVIAAKNGMGICQIPSFVAAKSLADGTLMRILPEYELRPKNVYIIYPSKRFLDAKIKTWVSFLKRTLPAVLARHSKIIDDPDCWASSSANAARIHDEGVASQRSALTKVTRLKKLG